MGRRTNLDCFETDSEDYVYKPDPKVKRKKRKTANRKDGASVQQGKSSALLQLVVDMPLDVLLEIFKHLQLIDLMHLSRTSKALRSILMSRTSISVWKQVVANEGLPPCTNDFNEPQLAELIFGKSCDWCKRNVSGQEIIWVARIRACKRCIESTYESRGYYHPEYPHSLARFVPSINIKHKAYVDVDLHEKWCDEYMAKGTESEKSKWLEERIAEQTVISNHANACRAWFKSRQESHVAIRKSVIVERLRERGWGEELDKLAPGSGPTDTLTEVRKACQSELTTQTLLNLDEVLDRFMEGAKVDRLVRERKQFFKNMLVRLRETAREYSHTLPANHIFPNVADIYSHPLVKTALADVESEEALDEVLTGIQPSLPKIVDDCLDLLRRRLINLVVDEYANKNKSFDPSVLYLASTLFLCKDCQCDLTIDQAITHACRGYCYFRLSDDMEEVRNAIQEIPVISKIENSISFSLIRLDRFASVLHLCGINPNTTTAADMNETDPIIECLNEECSNVNHGRVTMKWISAVAHFQRHPTVTATVLDESEAEIVRARLLEMYQKETVKSNDHICIHCRDRGGSMVLMQHVKQVHGIDSPVYGQDVIIAPNARVTRSEFSLWPPKL